MSTISEQVGRPPAEQRVILHNISWETYSKLLAEIRQQRALRLFYEKGTLEIMSPLSEHEILTHIIEQLIDIVAEELGINIICSRSTTFKREVDERGFEGDSSFYIQHEKNVRGKLDIDLETD